MHSDEPPGAPSRANSRRSGARRSNVQAGPCRTEVPLSPIELALVAQLNLEMAAAYEEVADDRTARRDARQAAQESAGRWRERARQLQAQAHRAGSRPTVAAQELIEEQPQPYGEPERRTRERRTRDRRQPVRSPREALAHAERRTRRDRRQRERRRSAPPPM